MKAPLLSIGLALFLASPASARECAIDPAFAAPPSNCERASTERSEWIESVAWCDGVLYLKIKTGRARLYRYAGVPHETFDAFKAAPSPGHYFNAEFAPRYACSRVRD